MSFSFGFAGLAAIAYIIAYVPKLSQMYIPAILLFYTIMEFLQGVQYGLVNQCDSRTNQLLTEFAYVLVILQPLMWNTFFYINSTGCEKQIFLTGIAFSGIWIIVNLAARIMYTPANAQTREMSVFSSDTVSCTKKRASHLFWQWPSANFGDLTANYLIHLMIWFIPALLSTTFRWPAVILVLSAGLGAAASYIANEPEIFAAVWCYISVPIVILLSIYIAYN